MATEGYTPRKGNKYEPVLLIIAGFCSLLVIILTTLLILQMCRTNAEERLCITKACTLTASALISSMDSDVDPCKDFYKFACSGFIRKHFVPEDKTDFSHFHIYFDQKYLQLRNSLEKPYSKNEEPNVVFRVQEAYHVCLNISYNEKEEISSFRNFVSDVLQDWPLGSGSHWEPRDTLEEFLGRLEHYGLKNYLFDVVMIPRLQKSDEYNVAITGPIVWSLLPFQFPKTNEDDKDTHKSSSENDLKTITKYAHFFGNKNNSHIDMEEETLMEFRNQLSKIDVNLTDGEEFLSKRQRMTIQEFNNVTSQNLDWLKILNVAFQGSHVFKSDDVIDVVHLDYLKEMSNIFSNYSESTLRNFIGFENIKRLASFVEPIIEKAISDVGPVDSNPKNRWLTCLQWLEAIYPLVLTRLFAHEYVDHKGKSMVDDLIHFVQNAYKDTIKRSDWIDEQTKAKALLKAEKMRRMVAYPEIIFDTNQLEEEYKHLPQVYSSHILNAIQMKALTTQRNQKFLHLPIDHSRWKFNPLEINAFYDFTTNSIWFPSGILQLPFFEVNRLAAVNFGMIGSIIGHEVGHGFDVKGSRFDESGQFKKWWKESTYEQYQERTKCFEEQYDKFCPEDLYEGENKTAVCVDGKSTLGENIADNTGLKAAYQAYKFWTEEHGKEKRLPGLEEFSPEQIFFISFAHMWCENVPIDKWVDRYTNDPHASGHFRVLGSLANYNEFAEAFQCPLGSMRRGEDSCNLW